MTWDESLSNLATFEMQGPDDDESNSFPVLRENPNYFIWYGPDRRWISGQYCDRMVEQLLEFSRQPRSLKEIEAYEFTEYNSLQELILFFVEAYLTIKIRGKDWSFEATRLINGGKKLTTILVNKGNVNADYLPAVEYLHRWILANIVCTKGKLTSSRVIEIASYANYSAQWEELPVKSKALLLATKCLFLSSMRMFDPPAKVQSIQDLRQVVRLDPLVYEWHYLLGNWIRCERKSLAYVRKVGDNCILNQCPTEEEMQTLWETYDVCAYKKTGEDGKATNLRRSAIAGVCQVWRKFYATVVALSWRSPSCSEGYTWQILWQGWNLYGKMLKSFWTKRGHRFRSIFVSEKYLVAFFPINLETTKWQRNFT